VCKEECPQLASRSLKYFIPFPTAYSCEHASFPIYLHKMNIWKLYDVESDEVLKLSSVELEFRSMVSIKQHNHLTEQASFNTPVLLCTQLYIVLFDNENGKIANFSK
jgi:hypothetical protein